jgi:O-antigen ligase
LCAQLTTTLGAAKGRNAVRTAILVYGCCLLLTFGYASAAGLPVDEVRALDRRIVLAFALIGLSLAICDGIRARDRLDVFLKVMVVGGAIIAMVAALQFALGIDLTQMVPTPGLRYSTEDAFVSSRADLRRASGTTGNPIEFGLVCATILPFAVHYAFRAQRRGEPARIWWICAALIAAGLMFSVSRSAVLGIVVAGTVLVVGWPARRRIQMFIAGVVFLGAMKIAVPGLLGVFYNLISNAGSDSSIQFRTHDYPIVLAEVNRHVFLGRGLGSWLAPKHQILDNQYLLSLVEVGVVGLVAFVGLFAAAVYAVVRARRLTTDPVDRDLGLTVIAATMVPVAGAITFDLLSFPVISGLVFVLVGVAGAYLRIAIGHSDASTGTPDLVAGTTHGDPFRTGASSKGSPA